MVFTANTVGEARAALHHYLNDGTESDQLLCHVLNCNRARLYAHPEAVLAPAYRQHLTELLQKRLDGTPLAYLTSVCEFFSLEFEVTPAVLIPRAETETLVETALTLIPESTPDGAHVLDLGTGCGAIAIAIAHARPDATIIACDNNRAALTLARRNAERHGVSNVSFVESDWFEKLPDTACDTGAFNLIAANPPYVAADDPALDPNVIAHEPDTALLAANKGLACLQQIIADAPARLRDRGALALEHGYNQVEDVARMMRAAGLSHVHCTHDLAGHPRVTVSTKQPRSEIKEQEQ